MSKIHYRSKDEYREAIKRVGDALLRLYGGRSLIQKKGDTILGRMLGLGVAVWGWFVSGFKSWNYNTTSFVFGDRIYLPDTFEDADLRLQYATLLHEVAHLNHKLRNTPDLLFSCTQDPLPRLTSFWFRVWHKTKYVFSAKYRREVEFYGYLQTMRVVMDFYKYLPSQIFTWFVATLSSGLYGWMYNEDEAKKEVLRMEAIVAKEMLQSDFAAKLLVRGAEGGV